MKIAFIATGDIAIPTFRDLIENGPKPVLLITQPDKPIGRSQSSTIPPAIKVIAEEHGIPVLQPQKIGEITEELNDLKVDYAVVMAYGQIIGKAVREAPVRAMINLHASLLPKYRGASCIQSAIENGDPETGITVIHVIRQLDAGAIISAARTPVNETETGGVLHDRLADLGPEALRSALSILEKDANAGTPQSDLDSIHSPKLLREHGRLDLSLQPTELERKIRAYDPWPGTFTEVSVKGKSKRLKIFPPTKVSEETVPQGELRTIEGELHLGSSNGSLILSEVQPEGSKRMPAQAFANQLKS